ncbi:diguanylate cyclase [Tumidithrix elongata RA019]|uniref:Diguanylate cyclase n=1 Tax=Tumidithrix elongata BACA0141 TaxID=2716417 RepID=A0AAW9Q6R7_9CYAN|nr:diguanylate cyclase [Tumidithrix elongata RA019]
MQTIINPRSSKQSQVMPPLLSNSLAFKVLESVGTLVMVVDLQGRIIFFNPACEAIAQYSSTEVQGCIFWEKLLPAEEAEIARVRFASLDAHDFPYHSTNHWQGSTGDRVKINWTETLLLDTHDVPQYVIFSGFLLESILEPSALYAQLQQANQELNRLCNYDHLTQIHNRRCFDHRLAYEWHRLAREQQVLSVLICDIDFFKAYNDIYGHLAGDLCLKRVASAIDLTLQRPADFAARFGGEEFAIILPNTDIDGARYIAKQICDDIKALQIVHEGSAVSNFVTISCGISCLIPVAQDDPMILVGFADHALYEAKRLGRDRIYGIG